MSVYDASDYASDLLGWKSELGARLQDFLARKAVPVSDKLGGLARKLEGAVSTASLKAAVSELLHYLRRESAAGGASAPPAGLDGALGDELAAFAARVREFRRHESIENYGAYLFSVDVSL